MPPDLPGELLITNMEIPSRWIRGAINTYMIRPDVWDAGDGRASAPLQG